MWKLIKQVGKSHWDQKDLDHALLISPRSLDFSFQEDWYGKFMSYHHQTILLIGCFILQIIWSSRGVYIVMAALFYLFATTNWTQGRAPGCNTFNSSYTILT